MSGNASSASTLAILVRQAVDRRGFVILRRGPGYERTVGHVELRDALAEVLDECRVRVVLEPIKQVA